MIDRVRESRNPKKVIRVSLMESYGEIGRVPVNLSKTKLSIFARRIPKGDAPNGRRKRSESPLVGRWGKAPYPKMLR